MFDQLLKHHLGFVVPSSRKGALEDATGGRFIFDPIQKTHVLLTDDPLIGMKVEFICKEGRVAHARPGFAHLCYAVADQNEFTKIDRFILANDRGFRLTALEPSVFPECGMVTFYYLKNFGVIELAVPLHSPSPCAR